MKTKNEMIAWGLQDLFLKMEGLEMLDIPFRITKIMPTEPEPLSKYLIEFDNVAITAEDIISPVNFID